MIHKAMLGTIGLFMLALAGCNPGVAAADKSEYTKNDLHVYQVPEGHEAEVRNLLQDVSYPISAVSSAGVNTVLVHIKPKFTGGGHFVVSAPEGIHKGIRELVSVLAKSPPRQIQPSVECAYWLVLGWPAEEVEIHPRLTEVRTALESLAPLGPMRFELLEKIQIRARDGEQGRTKGLHAQIDQAPSVESGRIGLRMEIFVSDGKRDRAAQLETGLSLKPDQIAVLGEAGFRPQVEGRPDAGEPTLFYLARARIVE